MSVSKAAVPKHSQNPQKNLWNLKNIAFIEFLKFLLALGMHMQWVHSSEKRK